MHKDRRPVRVEKHSLVRQPAVAATLLALPLLCALLTCSLWRRTQIDTQAKASNQQQLFCGTDHPESLPGVNTINIEVRFNRTTKVSFPLHVYTSDDVVSNALVEGGWEPNVIYNIGQALQRSSIPHPLFVDVGANIGYHTMVAAVYGYRVIAFEGMEQNARVLRANLCDNPTISRAVTLFPVGLGARKETCSILVDKHNRGDGVVRCPGPGQTPAAAVGNLTLGGQLQLYPLDSFVAEEVHLMKLDVEGFEPYVVEGAQELLCLHGVKYLIFEFTPKLLESARVQPRRWLDTVHDLGYKCSNVSIDGPWLDEGEVDEILSYGSLPTSGVTTPWSTDLFCMKS